MATPPVFSAGAVLTASQMNAVGLWLIKTVSIGTGVGSVSVDNVFSSDFDNYRVTMFCTSATSGLNIELQLKTASTTTTTNYKSYLYTPVSFWTSGAPVNTTSTSGLIITYGGHPNHNSGIIDVVAPNLAKATRSFGNYATDTNGGITAGIQTDNTQFTGFNLVNQTGTMTTGAISVYGYRD